MSSSLAYIKKNSVIHSLNGSTKFLFFLIWSIAAMITYDTRILVSMFFLGGLFFVMSGIKWKEVKFAVCFMLGLIALNLIALYFFAPEQGVEIYGTGHELLHLFGVILSWRSSFSIFLIL